jgi:hypothetical protein
MSSTDREEALSRAYVAAIAAGAGYVTALMDLDRDGVDVQIRAGGAMRPNLDLQLKATINLGASIEGKFRFPLKRRNYDLLLEPTMIPRILVVLGLPRDPANWLSTSPEELTIRHCAYWVSPWEFPQSDNKESVTVPLPEENRFDVQALGALMNKARSGSIK